MSFRIDYQISPLDCGLKLEIDPIEESVFILLFDRVPTVASYKEPDSVAKMSHQP